MHRTYELSPLLLIEGISVPLSRAQITYGINRPAIGVFDVVPLREINDIKPRTLCQLFVKNYMGPSNDYVLAYEGEVFAYGFGCHAAGQRSFQIKCMDASNYYDYASIYFADVTKSPVGSNAMGTTPVEANAGTDATIVPVVNGIKSNLATSIININKTTKDIAQMVKELSKDLVKINAFFKANATRHKLFDRLVSTSAGDLEKFFQYDLTEGLVASQLGNLSQFQSFRDVLQLYMGMIYHEMVTLPFPIMKDGNLQQYLIKPEAYMLAPPACNVVFPNQYTNMNIERNFFSEITRVRMAVPPTTMGGTQPQVLDRVFVAPSFYEEMLGINPTFAETYLRTPGFDSSTYKGVTGAQVGKPSGNSDSPVYRENNNYSQEEIMKGIFMPPPIYPANATRYLIETAKQDKQNQADKMFQNALYYEYYKGRYANRRTSITGRLNFAVVPGFNVMFVDATDAGQNVVGMLESVTHVFGSSFGSNTIYDVSYVRNVEEKQAFGDNQFADAPIPPWFNEGIYGKTDYADAVLSKTDGSPGAAIRDEMGGTVSGTLNNFGGTLDTYYKSFLGVGGCTSDRYKSLPEASRHYSDSFRNADDKEAYIRAIIQRPYATLAQVMSGMGAKQDVFSEVNNTVIASYSGGLLEAYPNVDSPEWSKVKPLFNKALQDRRKVISRYAKRIKSHPSFGGR